MTVQLPVDQSPAWERLLEHQQRLADTHLRDLFANDPQRSERLSAQAAGICLDFSKNRMTDETLTLLVELARSADLEAAIEGLFSGAIVNRSEHRPALHTALRNEAGQNAGVEAEVAAALAAMTDFVDALRRGAERGSTGAAFTDVVNLGIGGSDLGPRLVVDAFPHLQTGRLRVHFVASIDSGALAQVLSQCRPHTTLFLISSKSFSTLETLANAAAAKNWLGLGGIEASSVASHFVAMTNNGAAARAWGIDAKRILPLGEWVGGRFSLWSTIGLPIAIAIGSDNFNRLRVGAKHMDSHFRNAPLATNLPVLLGLLNIWYINFWGSQMRAVLPYVHNLRLLPDYLQQLVMESLGKGVTQTGDPVAYATGPVIWGSEGTNGQHSFHQLLLQGSALIPVDFILTAKPHCDPIAHGHLVANCLAQSRALMLGKTQAQARAEILATNANSTEADFLAAQKAIPGNRPSNTLVLDELTPESVGALLALYEHSVYTQSVIWGINAFDQWGVEIGKQLSVTLFAALSGQTSALELDSSSQYLLRAVRKAQPSSAP